MTDVKFPVIPLISSVIPVKTGIQSQDFRFHGQDSVSDMEMTGK